MVFDLDGTLIDSRADLANSTNDMLVAYGASPLPEPQVTSFVGEGARTLVTRDYGYFVENRLRQRFGLEGVPVIIDFKGKK